MLKIELYLNESAFHYLILMHNWMYFFGRFYSCLLFCIYLQISSPALGQDKKHNQALIASTFKSINNLAKKVGTDTKLDTLIDDVKGLSTTAGGLMNTIEKVKLKDTTYINSLISLQKEIDFLAMPETAMTKALLKALTRDYELKLNAAPPGLSNIVIEIVKVRVTKTGGNSSGFDVRANYLWEQDNKNARFIFNNPTNNAERKLAPGFYLIWLEKNGKRVICKAIEIGNLQSATETIQF